MDITLREIIVDQLNHSIIMSLMVEFYGQKHIIIQNKEENRQNGVKQMDVN